MILEENLVYLTLVFVIKHEQISTAPASLIRSRVCQLALSPLFPEADEILLFADHHQDVAGFDDEIRRR